jgi:hypothetical protein
MGITDTSSSLNITRSIPIFFVTSFICKGKGKAIPLQTWTGPEGSRRLRFPDFKTIGT